MYPSLVTPGNSISWKAIPSSDNGRYRAHDPIIPIFFKKMKDLIYYMSMKRITVNVRPLMTSDTEWKGQRRSSAYRLNSMLLLHSIRDNRRERAFSVNVKPALMTRIESSFLIRILFPYLNASSAPLKVNASRAV